VQGARGAGHHGCLALLEGGRRHTPRAEEQRARDRIQVSTCYDGRILTGTSRGRRLGWKIWAPGPGELERSPAYCRKEERRTWLICQREPRRALGSSEDKQRHDHHGGEGRRPWRKRREGYAFLVLGNENQVGAAAGR
jgi:hypothetical protein